MTCLIEQLRYVHLGSRDAAAAARFAQERLGMRVVSSERGQWKLRSDARAWTLLFSATHEQAVGLQVHDPESLSQAAERLVALDIASRHDDALARERDAKDLLSFTLPGGARIELVLRSLDQGWRFFPSREIGLVGLADVALRSVDVEHDEAVLVQALGLQVRDRVGDAAYLGFDEAHHRLSLHPSSTRGVLAVEYAVDDLDELMQGWYRLLEQDEVPAHGPGRRPASEQAFLTFDGPDGVYFSFVAEGREVAAGERPRQFSPEASSYCSWGSPCRIAEYGAQGAQRPRPQLRGV